MFTECLSVYCCLALLASLALPAKPKDLTLGRTSPAPTASFLPLISASSHGRGNAAAIQPAANIAGFVQGYVNTIPQRVD